MGTIKPGQLRSAHYHGQPRTVKVICSVGENPGHWTVEDVHDHSQFKLPTSAFDPAPDDEPVYSDEPVDRGEPADRGVSAESDKPADKTHGVGRQPRGWARWRLYLARLLRR